MKKKIIFSSKGQRADIGEIIIHRILPNSHSNAVGPFVFLDHFGPLKYSTDKPRATKGIGAHPHRGIATLTYLLNGESEHNDSRGNHAKVYSGGIQWMKAGNGILHDETTNPDPKTGNPYIHEFQFWINLPSDEKKENPEYLSIDATEVPTLRLGQDSGWLKVLLGKYGDLISKIPTYSNQFLFHVQLNKNTSFSFPAVKGLEYANFLPQHGVSINEMEFDVGSFIQFDTEEGIIEIRNSSNSAADIIFFGGERYEEQIVAHGPFVMNSVQEIAEAYKDFRAGQYGKIHYSTI